MSTNLPFPIRMARESDGLKIEHFKTVQLQPGQGEIKLFNTEKKIFVVSLDQHRALTEFVTIHRRQNTSLLGVEGAIEEAVRRGMALGTIPKQLCSCQ